MAMKAYLHKIDTTALGNRYDITPLFVDAECFAQLVGDLVGQPCLRSMNFGARVRQPARL